MSDLQKRLTDAAWAEYDFCLKSGTAGCEPSLNALLDALFRLRKALNDWGKSDALYEARCALSRARRQLHYLNPQSNVAPLLDDFVEPSC